METESIMIPTIVIGTHNPAKVESYRSRLLHIAERVVSPKDLGISDKPRETGDTAEENVRIKCNFYATGSGLPVVCIDEALYADFLSEEDQPGVHVRRIRGVEEVSDERLFAFWEERILQARVQKRTGKWHVAYGVAIPQGDIRIISRDEPIQFFYPPSSKRIPGRPLSSLQGPTRFGKPHCELTSEEIEQLRGDTDQKIEEIIRMLCS